MSLSHDITDWLNHTEPIPYPLNLRLLADRIAVRLRDGGLAENEIKNQLRTLAPLEFSINPSIESTWHSYFGPRRTLADGNEEYPNLSDLNSDTVEDWTDLAVTLSSPIIRARFADAAWELGKRLGSPRKDLHRFGRLAAEMYIEAASEQMSSENFFLMLGALNRGIILAMKFNELELADRGMNLMMSFADSAKLEHIGFWSAPFDHLIGLKALPETKRQQILNRYEARFRETIQSRDLFRISKTGSDLAKYFHNRKEFDRAKATTLTFGETVLDIASGLNASLATHHMGNILEAYRRFGLREDADRVRLLLEAKGKAVKAEMKVRHFVVEHDRNEMESSFAKIMDVADSFVALYRLANSCVPKPERIRNQLDNGGFIAHRIMPVCIIGDDGLPVSTVATYDQDKEGHIVMQVTREMTLGVSFFLAGLEEWKKKFNLNSLLQTPNILNCPLISPDRLSLYEEGLKAFENEDYVKCIHVLIPQIENSLRVLLEILEIPITKTDDMGGFELKNMNDVLHDLRVRDTLDETLWYFLKALYSDKRGTNLRNLVSHGIARTEVLNRYNAALVIQSILFLAVIREDALSFSKEDLIKDAC